MNRKHIAKMSHAGKACPDKPVTIGLPKVLVSVINLAGWIPSGYIIGQNGADHHTGTIRVPVACVFSAWHKTRGTRYSDGHIQLRSFPQLQVKTSTASVPGHQYLELNRRSRVFT